MDGVNAIGPAPARQGFVPGNAIWPHVRAHGKRCIIGDHRVHPGYDGFHAGPQALHVGAGRGAGDPLAFATGHGGAAVHTHGGFHRYPGQTGAHTLVEAGVDAFRLILQQTASGPDTGGLQQLVTTTGHFGIGVFHGADNAGHTGLDQGLRTGWGLAVMAAGFQGDIGGGPVGIGTGLSQGIDFGVALTGDLMPALPYHAAFLHQYTAHPRIGVSGIQTTPGQSNCFGHMLVVGTGKERCGHGMGHYLKIRPQSIPQAAPGQSRSEWTI